MIDQRMILFQKLVEAILATPGDTSPELRSTLAQHTARLCNGASQEGIGVPHELETYIRKVALHAYRVTDQDIEGLRNHGESWDTIFEITLSAALGAGMNCLTQGMAAVQGAKNALEEH